MALRLLTLDCANTLLKGHWDPVAFALEAAREAGICLPQRAEAAYRERLRRHYPAILAANRADDPTAVREAYVRLGEDWLGSLDVAPSLAEGVVAAGENLLFSPTSGLYSLFPETIPFLQVARAKGVRLAVVSNWDVSLPRVLSAHGLETMVDRVYASLVVGAEKPDPTMILMAMAAFDVVPTETMHVGDSPEDDLGAAENAGVRGVLVDRSGKSEGSILSLMEVLP